MAGNFNLLYSQTFTATDTIVVNHSLDRYQMGVIVSIGGSSDSSALISSIDLDPLDPRNSLTITLASAQTGLVKIVDTDYSWANMPTPEESTEVSQLTSSVYSPGGDDTQVQFNDGGSNFSGSSNFVWLKASNTLSVDGAISGSGIISGSAFYGDGGNLTNLPSAAITTYNTSGNDRIVTSVNATTVQGEANLTFDGTTLAVTGDISGSGNISGSAFYGDGSSLAALNATNISAGTLDNARLPATISVTNVTASTLVSASAFYGDGSNLTGIAAGSDTQVQFRDAGGFAADVDFTWNKLTNILTLGGMSGSGNISGSAFYGDGTNLTGPIQESLVNVKGDLLAATAADTVDRLAVGADTFVLTADSAEPTGIKWAAASGGGTLDHAALTSNLTWATSGHTGAASNLAAFTAGGAADELTATEARTLLNVEDGADVTDATNVAAAGAIMETLADAKGDLLAASADNTVTRLAVGSNNDILTADSSQSTGVRWATPAEPVYVDYYDAATTSVGTTATTLGLDRSRQSNALFVLSSDQVTVQTNGAGDYFIRYDVTFRDIDNNNREIECWMEINGTEVTATRSVFSHWDEHGLTTDNTAGRSVIITLSDGDVIRLRSEVTNGVGGYTTDTGGVSLQVLSIGSNGTQGPTGAQGPTGSGSTITVEDEGSIVSGGPHSNLDFVGAGVTATDAGSGVATITITGGSANIAQYRQTGNLTINTSATTVVLNANDFEDSNYTRSGENITINTAGVYQISYQVYFATNGNFRRSVDAWVENNTVEIVPSRASSYSRNTVDDTASSGATFLVQLAASDVVRLRAQSTGTNGTAVGQGNRMWITVQFVRAP